MKTAVVDDEKVIREQINALVQKYAPGACVSVYESGRELLGSGDSFDIVFLDIQMEGLNGIETAQKLKQRKEDTIIIFITGIREYVFEAFDVAAFHYLLKPVDEAKFAEVFRRAEAEIARRRRRERHRLFLKSKGITLEQNQILYIESRGKKAAIHTSKEVIEIYAVMSELEKQLSEGFYRCHRGYLVNMEYITEYDNDSITLKNGDSVYLTKKKHSEFVKTYMWYLQNGGASCV
ncbi:MAG: LytTR family DNA-binding domain-containing protein [Lachnospiraceae bacterium]|nr:LytTR family DNA-binding domain-containing protein [Lachnospiraceae bacterium]